MVRKVVIVVVVFILFFVLVFKTDFDPTRQNVVVNWLWQRPIKGVHMYAYPVMPVYLLTTSNKIQANFFLITMIIVNWVIK